MGGSIRGSRESVGASSEVSRGSVTELARVSVREVKILSSKVGLEGRLGSQLWDHGSVSELARGLAGFR